MTDEKKTERKLTLRITDEDLYAALKAEADRQERSVHAQILWLLRQGLDLQSSTRRD